MIQSGPMDHVNPARASDGEQHNTYKLLSKFYDLFDLIFLLDRTGNPRGGLLRVLANEPLCVLDVCVGTAASSIVVASRNTRNQIVGIDISPEMLAVARKKVAARRLKNVDLRLMSADQMQFADSSFDAAMISFALHEFDEQLQDRVLNEVSRVLKDGGLFCLLDFGKPVDGPSRFFMKGWSLLEPACFRSFLHTDWQTSARKYGLQLVEIQAHAFSNLYVFCKN